MPYPGFVLSFLHNVMKLSFRFKNESMGTYLNTLRKHAHMIYSNFFRSKIDNFQRKNFDIFLIFAQNTDCGYTLEPPRRGGSNEYPQSMFWSKNKKNRYTRANPSFTV